ncbi:MAG TPA: hypothetical protein DIS96_10245 [Pusillimonas sp.]|nr:hypothetical protein [Pusillimonas sp.]
MPKRWVRIIDAFIMLYKYTAILGLARRSEQQKAHRSGGLIFIFCEASGVLRSTAGFESS